MINVLRNTIEVENMRTGEKFVTTNTTNPAYATPLIQALYDTRLIDNRQVIGLDGYSTKFSLLSSEYNSKGDNLATSLGSVTNDNFKMIHATPTSVTLQASLTATSSGTAQSGGFDSLASNESSQFSAVPVYGNTFYIENINDFNHTAKGIWHYNYTTQHLHMVDEYGSYKLPFNIETGEYGAIERIGQGKDSVARLLSNYVDKLYWVAYDWITTWDLITDTISRVQIINFSVSASLQEFLSYDAKTDSFYVHNTNNDSYLIGMDGVVTSLPNAYSLRTSVGYYSNEEVWYGQRGIYKNPDDPTTEEYQQQLIGTDLFSYYINALFFNSDGYGIFYDTNGGQGLMTATSYSLPKMYRTIFKIPTAFPVVQGDTYNIKYKFDWGGCHNE